MPRATKTAPKKRRGDKRPPLTRAQQQLAEQWAGLAEWCCQHKYTRLVEVIQGGMDEAIGIARLALCEAARRFDPKFGVKFKTYATSYIKGYLMTAGSGLSDLIRIKSRDIAERKIVKSIEAVRLHNKHHEPMPSLREELRARPESEPALESDERAVLRKALTFLSPKQRRVIEGRFFQSLTLHELAKELHHSRERVRQIQETALARLQTLLVHDGDGLQFFPTFNIEAD